MNEPEPKGFFQPPPVTQLVYQYLRKAILTGEYEAGQWINVDQLTQQYKVSKTPIREALKALEQEHLIKYVPRKGFFAVSLSLDELKDLADLRTMLELHALNRGFDRIDRNQLEEIRREFETSYAALQETGEADNYLKTDNRFHTLIMESSGNRRMLDIYEGMSSAVVYLRKKDTYGTEANVGHTMPEHMDLIQAILDRDRDLALKILKNHLEDVEKRLIAVHSIAEKESERR